MTIADLTWQVETLKRRHRELDEQVANLHRAFTTSRTIATAVGVLMVRRSCTQDAALCLLREVSQRVNRRVADLAEDVVMCGGLLVQGPAPVAPTDKRRDGVP